MPQKTVPDPEPQPEQAQEYAQDILRYEWSIVVDASRHEQFIIRSHDLADLLNNRALLFELFAQEEQQHATPEAAPAQEHPTSFCSIHNVQMKLRTGKNGNTWFDHRWQDENTEWHVCNGKSETIQQHRS